MIINYNLACRHALYANVGGYALDKLATMTTTQYTITVVTVILTSMSYKTRTLLNAISQNITEDKTDRNKYEVVMQPKWLLHSVWVLAILWLYLTYDLFQTKGWLSLIYIMGFYFSVILLSKLLPFPSVKSLVDFFYNTVTKRLSNEMRYTFLEIQYLKTVKIALDKIRARSKTYLENDK